jgi:hypothetical protein
MVQTPKTIHVRPDSELDRLLDAVGDVPLELERDGIRYRLNRINAPMADAPSPERVARSIAGIRQAAGGWHDLIDADAFTEYVRRRRRAAGRPSVTL